VSTPHICDPSAQNQDKVSIYWKWDIICFWMGIKLPFQWYILHHGNLMNIDNDINFWSLKNRDNLKLEKSLENESILPCDMHAWFFRCTAVWDLQCMITRRANHCIFECQIKHGFGKRHIFILVSPAQILAQPIAAPSIRNSRTSRPSGSGFLLRLRATACSSYERLEATGPTTCSRGC
jgi:hypothetical protein